MMHIRPYSADKKEEWNCFVNNSSNGTFIHLREYMDYHADRFADCSVMVSNDSGKLVALLPACVEKDMVYSHKGLTFGGLIVARRHFPPHKIVEAFDAVAAYYRCKGIRQLVYKSVPHIFTDYPSEADIYAINRAGAKMTRCQLSLAIPILKPLLFNETARQLSAKGNFRYAVNRPKSQFWNLLCDVLAEKYNAQPVHTLAEMELLSIRFPENIKLVEAIDADGTLLCGAILYIYSRCVHFQYIAVGQRGRRLGAFQWLVKEIVSHECQGKDYLDFGTSNNPDDNELNIGLASQKYGLGGRPVVFSTFTLSL